MKQCLNTLVPLLIILGACQQQEKNQQLTIKGLFADSTGKPIANMQVLFVEEKPNEHFNPFIPSTVVAQHVLRSDSEGRFSQPVSWHSGVFFTVASYPDSVAPYLIVSCSAETQGNTCRIVPPFPTTVSLTVRRFN